MQSNTYLYIIIASVLVGGFTIFLSIEQFEQVNKLEARVEKLSKKLEKTHENIKNDELKLKEITNRRRELQTESRRLTREIIETKRKKLRLTQLEEIHKQNIAKQEAKSKIYQEAGIEIRDQLQEDIALLEHSIQELDESFAKDQKRLEQKEKALIDDQAKSSKLTSIKVSNLSTNIERNKQKIRRVNNLEPNYVDAPWKVGRVLSFHKETQKIMINLGEATGIKTDLIFRVFSEHPGEGRIYKGFMKVQEVQELISIGVMNFSKRSDVDPVQGDWIGSLLYHPEGLQFYLAGDFSEKYSRERYQTFLSYARNQVLDNLSPKVDFFVMGKLAEGEVPEATAYGISIIKESVLSQYMGE